MPPLQWQKWLFVQLSVLIPVRNQDARPFVRRLLALDRSGLELEVLVGDDASDPPFGKWHAALAGQGVRVWCGGPHRGRAAMRNFLARQARHPWLLFADADSDPLYSDFLLRYARASRHGLVVVGGTAYAEQPPACRALRLRWHYGRRREQRPAVARRRRPWASFSTHNFLIAREVFFRVGGFDARLRGYGHEDTLFGESLRRAGIAVHHIDNPLLHLGLEPADRFLEKTTEAIATLVALEGRGLELPTHLGRFAAGWGRPLAWCPDVLLARWQARLHGMLLRAEMPPLWWFDLYKLLSYVREKRRAARGEPPGMHKHHP